MERSVKVLGAYRVDGGKSAVKRAFELQYEGRKLSRSEKKQALRGIQELFAGLVLLEAHGFAEFRQRGSHKQFRHPDGRYTTVPFHAGRDISPTLLRKIAADVHLTIDEFLSLL